MLISFRSFCILLRHGVLGLPRFRVSCRFQSIAWLSMFLSPFLSVCPIYFQRLLIVVAIGCCPVLIHKSLFEITPGQHTLRILLRHLLMNICTCLVEAVVIRHVSEPYSKTALTLVLKMIILVAVCRSVLLQIGVSISKAFCAFFLLAAYSSRYRGR